MNSGIDHTKPLGSLRGKFLLIILLCPGLFGILSSQALNQCPPWIPTVKFNHVKQHAGLTILNPQVAPMHRAALVIDSMIKKNSAFNSIPDARFRNSIYLEDHGGLFGAQINATAYGKKAWNTKCGLLPRADFIGADYGWISVIINGPGEIYSPYKPGTDYTFSFLEKIRAFIEPANIGMLADSVLYYRSGITGTVFSLLTYNGKIPWVPLTLKEYFDAYESDTRYKIE